jgi:hypothetical protein
MMYKLRVFFGCIFLFPPSPLEPPLDSSNAFDKSLCTNLLNLSLIAFSKITYTRDSNTKMLIKKIDVFFCDIFVKSNF